MRTKKSCRLAFVVILIMAFVQLNITAQINFPTQSNYKYLKGNSAQNINDTWINVGFDDSAWLTGVAPFRYGDGSGGTELNDMLGNYTTLFMRTTFDAQNVELINEVTFTVDWDDGFVVFVNGNEVFSQQAPSSHTYDTVSTGLHESGTPVSYTMLTSEMNLVDGDNTLAIFACNTSLTSSDFFIDLSVTAEKELAELVDSVGISYSLPSGFYTENFDLSISTSLNDVSIVYTLDGSNPQTSSTSITTASPAIVNIDPTSTTNRGATPMVVVRASVVKEGYKASKPSVRSYVYLDKVKTQTNPGYDWPTTNVNGQELDFDMDADVVNSAEYKSLIETALTDIPTISIVTDNKNLFDASTGIYVNAIEDGIGWERECSVEMFDGDGEVGFNVNAGLRIRGGYSRNDNYPKHAFRLFFREEYGYAKLNYPLFEDEGVDKFDKIDLRTAQNYSWANSDGSHNTFIREVFMRDVMGEMDQPYTRSRYYHLYLNGMYWGLYQTEERPEANFSSDYMGGDEEDYDVIKVDGFPNDYSLEATDGNLDKWQEVYDLTLEGFSSNENYFKLQGKDSQGNPVKGSEILVDIDNLIDYMLVIFYSGNYDAPVSRFFSNVRPNNMYAITDREDKSFGFKFLMHDAEHTMKTLTENRVNIADISSKTMVVTGFNYFHAQWLHYKLSENAEYRVRFADRVAKHFLGTGALSETANLARLEKRADQIDMAIIAESARWGDADVETPYTKDNAWLPEINWIKDSYFPYRTDIVIGQLEEYDLYLTTKMPKVKQGDEEILDTKVYLNNAISVQLSHASAEIYYTLDGTDPRAIGGGIQPSAIKITSGSSLSIPESARLKLRALEDGQNWSALKQIDFVAEQVDYSNFKITEVHYHPTDSIMGLDTISGKSYEFVEFLNTGEESAINLTGLVIDSAISYQFPNDALLAPGEYFVVAAKPSKFYDRYGMASTGNSSGSLGNGGEQIVVTNVQTDEVIIDFTYSDDEPWPVEADGEGSSLSSFEDFPTGDPAENTYWKASMAYHGSPFGLDFGTLAGNKKESVWANKASFRVYPNPTTDFVFVQNEGEGMDDFELKIFNIGGTLLYQNQYHSKASISLQQLGVNSGIYVFVIAKDNKTETHKVVYISK